MPDLLSYINIFKNILKEKELEAYLVGGIIRDKFLVREIKDIDIVINKRVAEAARYFADEIAGSFVVLDEDRDIYRVIKNNYVFDFARMIANNIREDLCQRDFTINGLALCLYHPSEDINYLKHLPFCDFLNWERNTELYEENKKIPYREYLIDPCGGINDIKSRYIRVISRKSFKNDPLRLWRAFRFSAQLDFRIEKETINLMKEYRQLAVEPAAERIREELIKILELEGISDMISYMEREFGLLSSIVPEISEMKESGENIYHQEYAWTHCLQVLTVLDEILKEEDYRKLIADKEIPLLKFAAIFHDIGKTRTRTEKDRVVHYYGHEVKGSEMIVGIMRKLKFSRKELSFVKNIVFYHMCPMYLYSADNLKNKGRYRFFQEAGTLTPLVLIHSMADKTASMRENKRQNEIPLYHNFINQMLDLYKRYIERIDSLYLSGNEVINILGLEEGPYIGKLLDKLRAAQGSGQINSKEEAVEFLKDIDSLIKQK